MYAVIEVKGHQHVVKPGDIVRIDKTEGSADVKVLLTSDGDKIDIGTPIVDSKMETKLLDDVLGEKISGYKYKAKSRYRRKYGFRGKYSQLQIISIS